MRLDFSNERVLAVVAHPDDAEILCAGTLARAGRDDAAIGVCVLCDGGKGQPTPPVDNLVEIRSREMRQSAELLGAELFPMGLPDGQLSDDHEQRLAVVEVFRQFRPTLVLAHSEQDYHADHRAASALCEAASWFCASKGHVTKSGALDAPPALWWMDTVNMVGFCAGFFINVTDFMDLKRQMIHCHKSQISRGDRGDFAPLEQLMNRQAESRGAQAEVPAAEAFCCHSAWKRARAW